METKGSHSDRVDTSINSATLGLVEVVDGFCGPFRFCSSSETFWRFIPRAPCCFVLLLKNGILETATTLCSTNDTDTIMAKSWLVLVLLNKNVFYEKMYVSGIGQKKPGQGTRKHFWRKIHRFSMGAGRQLMEEFHCH